MDRRVFLLGLAGTLLAACGPSSSSTPTAAPASRTAAPAQANGQTNHLKVSQPVAALSFVTFYVARNKGL
jgi:hypothetical protein